MHNSFTFLGNRLYLKKARYQNNNTALVAADEDGVPFITVSVNVSPLPPDRAAIKNYSENEGVFEALIAAGLVTDTGETIRSGFVTCPVARFNPDDFPES